MKNIIKNFLVVFTLLLLCLQLAACDRKPEFDDLDAASVDTEYNFESTQDNEDIDVKAADNDESQNQQESKQEDTKKHYEPAQAEPTKEEPKQEETKNEEIVMRRDVLELSEEQERQIKQTQLDELLDRCKLYEFYNYVNINSISIKRYYGTYNGCFAVMLTNSFSGYLQSTWDDVINDITFHYSDGNGITIWKSGKFYSLRSAYDQKFLSRADLQSIADIQCYGYKKVEIVMRRDVLELSEEQERQIKQTRLDKYKSDPYHYPDAIINDIRITGYYGTYNGCIVLMTTDRFSDYSQALWNDVLADITFRYGDGNSITVWKDGNFYSLRSAYDQKFLSRTDLQSIANYYPNANKK